MDVIRGYITLVTDEIKVVVRMVWFGLLGFNASATARVISRR